MAKKTTSSRSPRKQVATKERSKENETRPAVRKVPLDRRIPVGQRAVFSNHMVVQNEPGVFQLFFFQINHPLLAIDDPELLQKELAKIESIDAECVSRVIVPVNLMPAIIKALQDNFSKQQSQAKALLAAAEVIDANSQSTAKSKER